MASYQAIVIIRLDCLHTYEKNVEPMPVPSFHDVKALALPKMLKRATQTPHAEQNVHIH